MDSVDQQCLVRTWHELEILGFAFSVEFCILWQAGTGCGGILRGITCNYLIRDQSEAATGKCQSLVPGSGIHQSQAQGQDLFYLEVIFKEIKASKVDSVYMFAPTS